MGTSDERLKILQMLEDGKISADDAAILLRALDGGRRASPRMTAGAADSETGRYLRVCVTDIDTGQTKVNVSVPLAMVHAGLRIAERFAPEFGTMDLGELEAMIATEEVGKVMEVVDATDNERVEVFVE
jgi:hypothetical protein